MARLVAFLVLIWAGNHIITSSVDGAVPNVVVLLIAFFALRVFFRRPEGRTVAKDPDPATLPPPRVGEMPSREGSPQVLRGNVIQVPVAPADGTPVSSVGVQGAPAVKADPFAAHPVAGAVASAAARTAAQGGVPSAGSLASDPDLTLTRLHLARAARDLHAARHTGTPTEVTRVLQGVERLARDQAEVLGAAGAVGAARARRHLRSGLIGLAVLARSASHETPPGAKVDEVIMTLAQMGQDG